MNNCEQENIIHVNKQIINYQRWYSKQLLELLSIQMTTSNVNFLMPIKQLIKDIHDLSHRNYMNQPLYLETRRKKAQEVKRRIDSLYNQEEISTELYKKLKETLLLILFENFSKQILPHQTGIITAEHQKKEEYINPAKLEALKVLEPRQYIGIDPNAESDLDAPSLVTALTPPHYEQPRHDHWENRELTFYTWPSIWKYQTEGKEKEIKADFWDMIIFPPQTWHTIQNPTDHSVMNMSIKLPSALLDRGKEYTWAFWQGEKRSLLPLKNQHYTFDLSDIPVPYRIELYEFTSSKAKHTLQYPNKSLIYPLLHGEFLAESQTLGKKMLRYKDALLLAANEKLELESLLWEKWRVYVVVLNKW